jgi:hypothetical protein
MIYAQIGETLFKYEGMSEETVNEMLTEQNLEFVFLDEQTYLDKIAALENK